MRAVIQRVTKAHVNVDNKQVGRIGAGLLILIGIEDTDTNEELEWLAKKITSMRIFNDENGLMNLDVKETNGNLLVVSQFTLHAKIKKGNRPSFIRAAKPDFAKATYLQFCEKLSQLMDKQVTTGEFGAHMDVHLTNDGPVTIMIDTKNRE